MKQLVIHRYIDPGHSWFKVSKALLSELGISDKITKYSYKRIRYAYLEEDCDAGTLLDALDSRGYKYEIVEHHTNNSSGIRNYPSYWEDDEPKFKQIDKHTHILSF